MGLRLSREEAELLVQAARRIFGAPPSPMRKLLIKLTGDEEKAADFESDIEDAVYSSITKGIVESIFKKARKPIKWGQEVEHWDAKDDDYGHSWGQITLPETATITAELNIPWEEEFKKHLLRSRRTDSSLVEEIVKSKEVIDWAEKTMISLAEGILADLNLYDLGEKIENKGWDTFKIQTESTYQSHDEEEEDPEGPDIEVEFTYQPKELETKSAAIVGKSLKMVVEVPFKVNFYRINFPGDYHYHRR